MKAKDHSNVVSIRYGYLYHPGVILIPDPTLTVYNEATSIVTKIEDVTRIISFDSTLNKVKLLK